MAQDQFSNDPRQYPQYLQQVAQQQPVANPPSSRRIQPTGQAYDPRFYQQQQQQQYYQQQPQFSTSQFSQPQSQQTQQSAYPQQSYLQQAQAQQYYHNTPQPSSQHQKPNSFPQPQFPISSTFGQPVIHQYRPPPSPQPLQHQSYSFTSLPSPSSQPQQHILSQAQFSHRPPPPSQTRSTPSPTREHTTTASPRPRYAYLPQQPMFSSDSQSRGSSSNTSSGRPLPTPRGRPESMPPPPRSPMLPSAASIIRQPSISPTRSSRSALVATDFTVPAPLSLHRPSMSLSSVSTPKPTSTFSSRPSSPSHRGRPLPTPVCRSTKTQSPEMQNTSIRTPSPVKGYTSSVSQDERQINPPTAEQITISSTSSRRFALPPAETPGQPFIPHWRRTIQESQIKPTPTKHGTDRHRRGTVSGVISAQGNRDDLRQTPANVPNVPNGRPLPASPTITNSVPGVSRASLLNNGEDNRSEARTPSPQYGILDMPRSRFAARVEVKTDQNEDRVVSGARKLPVRSSTLPQPPTQSVTLQMASMSIYDDNNSRSPKAPASPSTGWPVNLPALPRAPKPPATKGFIDLDDAPPPSLRRSPEPSIHSGKSRSPSIPSLPTIRTQDATPGRTSIPKISFPADPQEPDSDSDSDSGDVGPMISISVADTDAPQTPVSSHTPRESVGSILPSANTAKPRAISSLPSIRRGGGLSCGGCGGAIIGRIVSAMNVRWHPECFRCCVCHELLQNLSSYEKDGRAYCHLDYHEAFAPKCYHCNTTIVDEQFITLDDHELGRRTYHEQHFFCAECGDPFLPPSSGNRSFAGDGAFEDDDVGFTVYKGHPYCESCHVRLRMPKCKKCKKSIRDGVRAVEALGGKWCWSCFVCAGCEQPFENPSFFQRDNHPFCERCFSIIIRNEM